MFDTVMGGPDLAVLDSFPCELAPLTPTVWDVLAGLVPPGPDAVRALSAVDPSDLDAATRADVVAAWGAQASWVEAQQLAAVYAMSLPEPVVCVDDPTDRGFVVVPDRVKTEETRLALGCSPAWAGHRVELARVLATRLPTTRGLLEAGRISAYLAGIAVTESQRLTQAECTVFEDRVFPRGASQTPARFRKACRLVTAVLHPEDLEDAHQKAKQATGVSTWPEPAGMASLRVHAAAPVIGELWDTVNTEAWAQARAAKKRGEEHVPIGERRVHALLRWARTSDTQLGAIGIDPRDHDPEDVAALIAAQVSDGTDLDVASEPTSPELLTHLEHLEQRAAALPAERPEGSAAGSVNPLGLPTGSRAKVQVGVIIDLDVVLGARDGPAILEGYGPIPASMARELAADGSWRRVLLEPVEGWLLDYGRRRYAPTRKLRDHLLGLGQDCRGAYCTARPRETDHGLDWGDFGTTSAVNMNGLCAHTHRLKTVDNFTVTNNDDGSITWTTPAGNTYTKPPDDLRITNYGSSPGTASL